VKILIVGAGLIGCERIMAVKKIAELNTNISLLGVYEPNPERRELVGNKFQVPMLDNLDAALLQYPDWVFICTPHDVVIPIIKQAFKVNANVLIEKPLGRSLQECRAITDNKPPHCKLYVGFNYRFFAGIEAALKDCRDNKFGKLISVNLTLGHGNAPGMEKSWKLDPIKCGGGCLIDPGVHLLDLILEISSSQLFLDYANSWSGFWNTGIEEETHLLFHDDKGTIYNAQVSLNRWKSNFRLEINGTEGYGIVDGRGRSYGPQSYRTGTRWGWQSGKSQAESEILVIDNDSCEDSFFKETLTILNEFVPIVHPCNHSEAEIVMELLENCQKLLNKST
jgi:predicted dehydrogenase